MTVLRHGMVCFVYALHVLSSHSVYHYRLPVVKIGNRLDTRNKRVYSNYMQRRTLMVRQMTERIAISPEVKERLTKFRDGAGATYDDAIEMLLDLVKEMSGDEATAGTKLHYAKKMGLPITPPSIEGL
jgi:hypothetical protein